MSCCACHHNQHKKTAIIKNSKSGLVLDASDNHVKIQNYTGSCAQLWYLECIDHGRFTITNKKNGKVLDIEGGAKSSAKLITHNKHGGVNQQWYVQYDGTIMSPAAGKLVLDIYEGKYYAGNNVIAFPVHGAENQIFKINYQ